MKDIINPVQGRLLIELRSKYKHIKNPTEERFGTSKIQGVVKAIAPDIKGECEKMGITVGCTVYFAKFEDSASYPMDGADYSLIKLELIDGWS